TGIPRPLHCTTSPCSSMQPQRRAAPQSYSLQPARHVRKISALRHHNLFFVADRRNHAAQQLRRHPGNVVLALRMARCANNHFIVVHAARDELASGNHVATSKKFFHGSSPQSFRGPEGRAETYKFYVVFCRTPANSSAVNTVESLRVRHPLWKTFPRQSLRRDAPVRHVCHRSGFTPPLPAWPTASQCAARPYAASLPNAVILRGAKLARRWRKSRSGHFTAATVSPHVTNRLWNAACPSDCFRERPPSTGYFIRPFRTSNNFVIRALLDSPDVDFGILTFYVSPSMLGARFSLYGSHVAPLSLLGVYSWQKISGRLIFFALFQTAAPCGLKQSAASKILASA